MQEKLENGFTLSIVPKKVFFPEEGHCVLKWGFTRTFPGNQDAIAKLKYVRDQILSRCKP